MLIAWTSDTRRLNRRPARAWLLEHAMLIRDHAQLAGQWVQGSVLPHDGGEGLGSGHPRAQDRTTARPGTTFESQPKPQIGGADT